ncbi:uncharacterized protein BO88DRAFT_404216 [Aspergillus vadensis CBS 113365]|uniref:Uncharacterized protein n=1 Tax=Aspergillus vadensis (strain CBS 113365 / IMI 142717 / IBT 24658) TaxID=1448311 RepID=A0A319BD42_ASPVC|nr:hypothetical protein BO88DRAFT_404216 [Aspergillus vadensis CBS 113365]PYH69864.1 hypothetical protein BO88DRAFT_404216 [Aspergillus vadensis CBS 113365]
MDRPGAAPDSSTPAEEQADILDIFGYREVVPEWTDDPRAFEGWFLPGTGEWYMARSYGITDPTLVLIGTNNSGEMGYIITANGRYYCGDLLVDYIFEITAPKTWPDILDVMRAKGIMGLKMKELKPVELPDDDDLPAPRV